MWNDSYEDKIGTILSPCERALQLYYNGTAFHWYPCWFKFERDADSSQKELIAPCYYMIILLAEAVESHVFRIPGREREACWTC